MIIAAKLTEGAWITLIAIPSLILLFKRIKRYYTRIERELREPRPLELTANDPPVVVLPIESWNKLTHKALRFGMTLSPEVIVIHLSALQGADADQETESLKKRWGEDVERPAREAGLPAPRLVSLPSPYRRLSEPLLCFLEELKRDSPQRLAVIIPEIVKKHWWQHLLHHRRARRLGATFLAKGGERIVVMAVPWVLEDEEPGKAGLLS